MGRELASYAQAVVDFKRARRRAALQDILARISGGGVGLLSYEEVKRNLRAHHTSRRALQEIPLDSIVGSVGRYADFTRSFLPRRDQVRERWARVKVAMEGLEGLPPIEVYRIGEAYFVRDGHHRVSVAREMGARSIQAYVTEVQAKVSLSAQAGREELILKQEYAQFLEATRLDEIRPGADLILSEPGGYEELEEHIAVHRYFMGLEAEREIRYTKAVAHWYDHIYLPVVQRIRELGILRHFPGRTETDLYLWVSKHRAALQETLGWEIDPGAAASDLAALEGEEGAQALERGITSVERPDQLDRLLVEANEGGERMFTDLLVPLRGDPQGWAALAQALAIARLEGGRILGLHVSSEGHPREEAKVDRMKRTFREHCEGSGVRGSLAIEVGTVATQICRRSTLSDLLVIHLAHPPERTPIARLSSGFRRLIRECAVPILAVPFPAAPIRRALLAYDGTPKANQALFLAAYLAGRWKLELSVITAKTNPQAAEGIQTRARKYLEQHQVGAAFLRARPPTGEAILEASERDESDLILMGGYGTHTLLTTVLGSTVDHVLRYSRRPVWICN